MIARAEERFAKIRQDPEQAVFGEFRGVSPGGAVTVWVDMLGRLRRCHVAPGSLHDGAESWLVGEFMAAHEAAKRSADVLDFDMTDLARELDSAPRVRDAATRSAASSPPARGDDDWFENQNVLG